jgi:RNA polymerase sigma factor (sigma-70 family)
MPSKQALTHWLQQLKEGHSQAAQPLWEAYYQRLVALARAKLQGAPRRAADEEDVALSAFASFCRGAEAARFPCLDDSTDLWRMLVVITARKAVDLIIREQRLKRGGCRQGRLEGLTGPTEPLSLEEVIGREPTPEFAVQLAEEHERLLLVLGDEQLRLIATRKVEGFTNEEIGEQLGRSVATVERKLHLIRQIWQTERGGDE